MKWHLSLFILGTLTILGALAHADESRLDKNQKAAHNEVVALAKRHPELGECVENAKSPQEVIGSPILRLALYYAAQESDWKSQAFKQKFPSIWKVGGAVGIVDEDSQFPKLVAHPNAVMYELIFNSSGEYGSSSSPYYNAGDRKCKIKTIGGHSFLLFSGWNRISARDEYQKHETMYVRIDGGELTLDHLVVTYSKLLPAADKP